MMFEEQKISMEFMATALFGLAVVHTFLASKILKISKRFSESSITGSLIHFLGEVEVVFGLWAMVFVSIWMVRFGKTSAVEFLESVNFSEAVFVFAIMCVAATRPVLLLAGFFIEKLSNHLPLFKAQSLYLSLLIVGPLLGSFITEPAAMTVVAILLCERFFSQRSERTFQYVTLAVLFVNISIGGTLTHFAAPPVLMVATPWGWDTSYMLTHFGWKAALAVIMNAFIATFYFRKKLKDIGAADSFSPSTAFPRAYWWMALTHIFFILPLIIFSHHIVAIVSIFIFFLGWHAASTKFQDDLRLKESLLVAFFLGGLVTLGNLQGWWIKPLLEQFSPTPLFWFATTLTAITDNAAITYLATLSPDISEISKYSVVAGAVTGGGLTLIANAPNLAGYSVLSDVFEDGFNPFYLFISAIPFTLVAALAFLVL